MKEFVETISRMRVARDVVVSRAMRILRACVEARARRWRGGGGGGGEGRKYAGAHILAE